MSLVKEWSAKTMRDCLHVSVPKIADNSWKMRRKHNVGRSIKSWEILRDLGFRIRFPFACICRLILTCCSFPQTAYGSRQCLNVGHAVWKLLPLSLFLSHTHTIHSPLHPPLGLRFLFGIGAGFAGQIALLGWRLLCNQIWLILHVEV